MVQLGVKTADSSNEIIIGLISPFPKRQPKFGAKCIGRIHHALDEPNSAKSQIDIDHVLNLVVFVILLNSLIAMATKNKY
uniref:Uncharacterized protein n=1 Tax=Glossina palpalis gambiensis TaxID=67801 RepID=A0A1B0BL83_9MUSC